MAIRRIIALILIGAGSVGLSACGGGGGGSDGPPPPPEIQTDWNDMNWDEGRWN